MAADGSGTGGLAAPTPDPGWATAMGGDGWRQHVGRTAQVADARLVELGDGAGRGVRVVELGNAVGLRLDVLVDRAMDLGACTYRGVPLAWLSPVGIQAPGLASDEHLGWLRGFGGGLLTTAGLDHTMFPEQDDTPYYAYPARDVEQFPLHGRLSRQPGRLVGYGVDHDASTPVLWVEGVVTQAAVFGEVFTLHRRIEVPLLSPVVRLRDRVTNAAHVPVPHMLLYHVNLGWPLLDEGAHILSNATSATPRGEHELDDFWHIDGPERGRVEEVTELRFDTERGRAALVNDELGLALVEEWATSDLPHLFVWRVLAAGNYVLGVEPSTNGSAGREGERAAGRLRIMEPGESRDYGVDLSLVAAEHLTELHPDLQRPPTTRRSPS